MHAVIFMLACLLLGWLCKAMPALGLSIFALLISVALAAAGVAPFGLIFFLGIAVILLVALADKIMGVGKQTHAVPTQPTAAHYGGYPVNGIPDDITPEEHDMLVESGDLPEE